MSSLLHIRRQRIARAAVLPGFDVGGVEFIQLIDVLDDRRELYREGRLSSGINSRFASSAIFSTSACVIGIWSIFRLLRLIPSRQYSLPRY